MITLIGMGSGTPESLTAQGLAAGLHGTPEGPVSA